MKKLFIPIISLLALTSLGACSNENTSGNNYSGVDYSDLKIAAPSGAPALAVYDMYKNTNVEINNNPSTIIGYLNEGSDKDIVIAPTNALTGFNDDSAFKIAGVVTFGNFYLVATGNDDDYETIDNDDYIVLFQKPGLPGKLFNYCYGTSFNTVNVAGVTLAAVCLETGVDAAHDNATVDYVLVSEPGIETSIAKAKAARPDVANKIKVVKNLQEDYAAKSGNTPITQASIFVRNTTDETKISKYNAFISDVATKFNQIKQNQDDLDAKLGDLSGVDLKAKFLAGSLAELKESVRTNTINIGYQRAKDYKTAIDNFLKNLGFASEDTNEKYYW